MKHKDVYKYVAELRAKHGRNRYKVPFPDLTAGSSAVTPCTNGFGQRGKGYPPPKSNPNPGLIVDTLHKQGPMVLRKSELPWAGGKKP